MLRNLPTNWIAATIGKRKIESSGYAADVARVSFELIAT